MALVNQGGKLLLQNGALASGSGCCCSKCSGPCDEENPCPPGCACVDGECETITSDACCFWLCEYIGDPYWPEAQDFSEYPDPALYSDAMIAAGWINIDPPGFYQWRKAIVGVENCNDPEVVAQKIQELQDEITAIVNGFIVNGVGGFGYVELDPMLSGPGCLDDTGQQYCEEELLGTYHPNTACFPGLGGGDPPCEENPLP